ncbi:MAG TPA: NAD(P)H-hydrate dehydratase [Streptosporangiaceae bacterium]|nr:NAD(P)H-hydrate dehydratase [Streptosporangiaceae bacterium]
MREAYLVDTVRAAERALMRLVPDGALMARAAAGLAATCAEVLAGGRPGFVYGATVTVLAGSGDNGGDALYAGAILARRGVAVTAIAPADRLHEGGAAALRAAGGAVLRSVPESFGDPDLILDGMLGIGGRGGLREPFTSLAALAAAARDRGVTVVAVDLPSGIDADTGAVDGPAVQADVTVTFGTLKPGLLIDPGAGHAGTVQLIDIGLAPHLLASEPAARAPQHADIRALLPRPGAESDKYRRGVAGLLAGSDRYSGAVVLATGGAIRGGAGMVRVVTAASAAPAVRQAWPEAVLTTHDELDDGNPVSAGRVQAWVAGPGMGTGDDAAARLRAVLAADVPVLVDADGLTLLARTPGIRDRKAPTLITPHAGELARLLGAGSDARQVDARQVDARQVDARQVETRQVEARQVEARRVTHARRAAAELGVTVLLKGSTTVIADPDRETVLVNPTGTPWLATAGSGDVLSGLAGALLAQGLAAPDAAIAAAYLHGLAARLAAAGTAAGTAAGAGANPEAEETETSEAPIGASDVIRYLPAAIRAVGS